MSAISSLSSTTNSYPITNQNRFEQLGEDFQAIGSALGSGNLAGAQSALATFQQNLPATTQASSIQPFGSNTQANSDYQNLASSLQSGNISNAQQAFAKLQTDLTSTHRGHHHHHSSAPTSSTATASNPTASFLSIGGNGLNVTA
jgi:hypothetical protein